MMPVQTMEDVVVAQSGRPRVSVDFALILHLRRDRGFGWRRVAREYINETGQYISRWTCKRRYLSGLCRGLDFVPTWR